MATFDKTSDACKWMAQLAIRPSAQINSMLADINKRREGCRTRKAAVLP